MAKILIDVDGVLNFDRSNDYSFDSEATIDGVTYPLRLDKRHGQWLLELAEDTKSDLMWATTWLELANIHIGPKIGLPELPYVDFGHRRYSQSSASWKGFGVIESIDDPFIWFDDDFDIPYILDGELEQKYRLHLVHGHCGLSREDIDFAYKWLSDL